MIEQSTGRRKFLVTPQIQKDESLRGFVTRVAHRNRASVLLRHQLASLSCASRSLHEFSQLTGISTRVLESHGGCVFDEKTSTEKVRFGGTLVPSNQVWRRNRYFCPLCLAEDGISKAYWDLKLYSRCHRHGVLMTSECSDCKRVFSWDSVSPEICKCGLSISAVRPITAPSSSIDAVCCLVAQSLIHTVNYDDSSNVPWTTQKFLTLEWTLLLIEIIKFVLIPAFLSHINWDDLKIDDHKVQELINSMLADEPYRNSLREAVFLHAAKDPMTMAQALSCGNMPELIQQLYKGCSEDIPFHASLWAFFHSMRVQVDPRIVLKKRKLKVPILRRLISTSRPHQPGIESGGVPLKSSEAQSRMAA